jgi:hypothetical protein
MHFFFRLLHTMVNQIQYQRVCIKRVFLLHTLMEHRLIILWPIPLVREGLVSTHLQLIFNNLHMLLRMLLDKPTLRHNKLLQLLRWHDNKHTTHNNKRMQHNKHILLNKHTYILLKQVLLVLFHHLIIKQQVLLILIQQQQ